MIRARPACLALLAALAVPALAQWRYWDAADRSKAPALLSQTGFYADIATKAVHPSTHYFEVNSPLWSDASHKRRWVVVKPGAKIAWSDTGDYLGYPDSTVFVKEFAIETREGDTASRVLWETRLLVLKKEPMDPSDPAGPSMDAWHSFSYRWNQAQTDAALVPDTGVKASIEVQPAGGKPAYRKKWFFPSPYQCSECHVNRHNGSLQGRTVLGFFTAQINRDNAAGENQILDFFDKGLFSGPRPAQAQLDNTLPRWIGIEEPGNSPDILEKKSRAYLAANCSGCHGMRGKSHGAPRGVRFNYDYHAGIPRQALAYDTTSSDYGLNGWTLEDNDHVNGVYLVSPGNPDKSVILYRQKERNTAPVESLTAFDKVGWPMPPLASYEVNAKAVAVMEEWIRGLPKRPATGIVLRPGGLRGAEGPVLRGRLLHVPADLLAGRAEVRLAGLDGRLVALVRKGEGTYALPAGLPRGLYVIRVGSRTFTRSLLQTGP